jgi:hypothetical protein
LKVITSYCREGSSPFCDLDQSALVYISTALAHRVIGNSTFYTDDKSLAQHAFDSHVFFDEKPWKSDLPPAFWPRSKVYSCQLQNSPFVFHDNDCFIWHRWPLDLDADFVFYSAEPYTPPYRRGLQRLRQFGSKNPFDFIDLERGPKFKVYNAGYIQCRRPDIYKDFYKFLVESISQFDVNYNRLIQFFGFSICFEQLGLSWFLTNYNVKIKHIYKNQLGGRVFPSNGEACIPLTHLMSKKRDDEHVKFVQQLREEIKRRNS